LFFRRLATLAYGYSRVVLRTIFFAKLHKKQTQTPKIKLKIFNIWQICAFIAQKQQITNTEKQPFSDVFCTEILTFGIFFRIFIFILYLCATN